MVAEWLSDAAAVLGLLDQISLNQVAEGDEGSGKRKRREKEREQE